MKISENKVVSLTYELKLNNENGELIQKVEKDKPFVYLFGIGGLLPVFEKSLEGLGVGETFSFGLSPDEGYGQYNEEAIVALDKNIFEVDGQIDDEMLQMGKIIPMQNEHGQPLNGVVVGLEGDKVTMDFNHPLAGKHLHFTGEILEVRKASTEELNHGHAHGPEGHHHH
ncbi:MAG: peptidylprolyl isomerase [Bacteroidetes bacterium HGW-Bacteroidetes-17]|jgi:FKBP-type peptidyl-prolyl cis-trans isomerase SlyD|nr:MAG: peptidylprolyl isomerase [Bacteroidetes bacterium HGW-Bacteroidetes-17]